MEIFKTDIEDVLLINLKKISDSRGFFTRLYCKKSLEKVGFNKDLIQMNFSFTKKKGTIRGMHYQVNGFEECKVVSCVQGSILDTIIDIRPKSKSYLKVYSIKLKEGDGKRLIVPEGFAHGFQTLEDNSSVLYQVSAEYSPENERGIRYNDPSFEINWPLEPSEITDKDLSHPDFIKK